MASTGCRRVELHTRTPVGLVNHSGTNFNWQLPVANGCLIKQPVLSGRAAGLIRRKIAGCSRRGFRAGGLRQSRNSRTIGRRLPVAEAIKSKTTKCVDARLEAYRDGVRIPPPPVGPWPTESRFIGTVNCSTF